MLRLLSSLCVALALFLSPMVMAGGVAMAQDSHAMTAGDGHCPPADEDSGEAKMDCMSACAAVPAVQPAFAALAPPPVATHIQRRHQLRFGVQPERETPPPRFAPAK